MKGTWFKKLLPHFIAVAVFAIVAIVYCKPVLQGKVLNQHDSQGWKGMAQQSFEVKEKTGHFPLWTNSMFAGMPAYQIAMEGTSNIGAGISFISKSLFIMAARTHFVFFYCQPLVLYFMYYPGFKSLGGYFRRIGLCLLHI